ncbi:MAG: hypothetical protein V3W34_07695 [Phycisphaerae bacterium]
MAKLPILKPREVTAKLETLGFVEVRERGLLEAVCQTASHFEQTL